MISSNLRLSRLPNNVCDYCGCGSFFRIPAEVALDDHSNYLARIVNGSSTNIRFNDYSYSAFRRPHRINSNVRISWIVRDCLNKYSSVEIYTDIFCFKMFSSALKLKSDCYANSLACEGIVYSRSETETVETGCWLRWKTRKDTNGWSGTNKQQTKRPSDVSNGGWRVTPSRCKVRLQSNQSWVLQRERSAGR